LAKFKSLLKRVRKDAKLFDKGTEIYLDSCVEVRSLPAEGLFGHITIRIGEDRGGMTASLIGAPEGSAAAFAPWANKGGDEKSVTVEPFLVFSGATRKRRAHG